MGKKKKSGLREHERKQQIEMQRTLSTQDDQMWMKNEGISQLEGRIETKNWQG